MDAKDRIIEEQRLLIEELRREIEELKLALSGAYQELQAAIPARKTRGSDESSLKNNHTEQQIRHCVIDRRITQGTRSERGQRYHERMWSAIATCTKQGHSFFDFLHDSILDLQQPPAFSRLDNRSQRISFLDRSANNWPRMVPKP